MATNRNLIFLLFCLSLFSSQLSFSQQKNVLFIFVDDLNTQLNCYGNKTIISPNIDKLAEQGTIFKHAYCQWSVCGPSRASILSGQMPAQTGIQNLVTQIRDVNPDIVTLPQYFKNRGYTTAAIGKVFDSRNVDSGHDTPSWSIPYKHSYQYPAEYGSFVKGQYRVTDNTATEMGPDGVDDDGYIDGQLCLDALSKLETLATQAENPFFLAVGFKKPHIPFISPKKYWDLYERDSLKLAPFQKAAEGSPAYAYFNPEPIQYDDIPDIWTYNDIELGDGILETDMQRKLIHGYYACVSYIDAQVGKILDKLEELELDENTIVLLVGDHGYHLGDHNQWGKHTNFENAVGAPLIIYAPGQGHITCYTPVDLLDIYPTLTSLAFGEIPTHVSGNDISPLMQGNTISKTYSVSEYRSSGHASYSFRDERFRLTLWMQSSNHRPDLTLWDTGNILTGELYDFVEDSLNTVNLYDDPALANTKSQLLQTANNWWDDQYHHMQRLPTYTDLLKPSVNPVKNSIIKDYFNVPETLGVVNLSVYDMQGRLVITKNNQSSRVYLGGLKQGAYVVLLEQENINETLSAIIVKD